MKNQQIFAPAEAGTVNSASSRVVKGGEINYELHIRKAF